MKRITVLVSGGGTNLGALIAAQERGEIPGGAITCVISSSPDAYALTRAAQHGIPTVTVDRKAYAQREDFSRAILDAIDASRPDLIVLAGFMFILPRTLTEKYPYRMMNVHPALIPSFCGDGFYGLRVHQAALDYGVKVTGATVHFVSEVTDGGPIILQKAVDIIEGDTAESLQKRVMEQAEWRILPRAVALFCADKLEVRNNKVYIKE